MNKYILTNGQHIAKVANMGELIAHHLNQNRTDDYSWKEDTRQPAIIAGMVLVPLCFGLILWVTATAGFYVLFPDGLVATLGAFCMVIVYPIAYRILCDNLRMESGWTIQPPQTQPTETPCLHRSTQWVGNNAHGFSVCLDCRKEVTGR